jgi:fatty acid desaturase
MDGFKTAMGCGKRMDVPALTAGEVVREVALPFLGYLGVMGLLWAGYAGVGVVAVGVLFALCIRLAHDLHHNALRLPRWVNGALLVVLSGMILSSMHGARRAHLAHHKSPMGEDDLEGAPGRRGFWGALALGAVAVPRLHVKGIAESRGMERAVIVGETALALGMVGLWMWVAATLWPMAWVYLGVMAAAHVFSPMVAVWAVHRGSGEGMAVSRTQESELFHTLTLGLMYHLEHHRYPGVATCRLWRVARGMRQRSGMRAQIVPGGLLGLGANFGFVRGLGDFRGFRGTPIRRFRGTDRGYFRGLEA